MSEIARALVPEIPVRTFLLYTLQQLMSKSGTRSVFSLTFDVQRARDARLASRTELIADAVFYLTTLCVGLYIRYLIEVMSRRAFLDRRECIESKIKIETEKNQEEKFLQSILPMHIAREVRNDIREAIKDMNRLRMSHKPFNKLYVEKHKGVSILYADIVNSMLLAASLKVSDLVATLNDLFGRFDEMAEVSL
ncbi:hypothetical protein TNIN_70821 [Trichonephila inaurata madagascariensis]|uniref:adenylate cyclase n=1 Tax=Trichonephila inaurata madagascariensis TaxID=2747483 RepID=A0A8X7CQR6_9ARAC|nr:hypothetical protein TNIN_70821 [Trichonephila inaurata madagascariensis]